MDRGLLEMNAEECKGCGLCVAACPPKVSGAGLRLNRYGYHPAEYLGTGCTGCGICFFACPEPGAIRCAALARRRREEEAPCGNNSLKGNEAIVRPRC